MNKRRHHYIWRNYLRAWANNEQIWCARNNNIFLTNLMNIGQERDFYRLNELTLDEIKNLHSLVNQTPSEMLRKLNHGWITLFTLIFEIRSRVEDMGIKNDAIESEIEKQIINLGEEFHCGIEESAIKLLDELLKNDTNFLEDDEHVISFIHYLCVQYFRTKKIKENASTAVAQLGFLDVGKVWNILSHIFATNLACTIYLERASWSSVILENYTQFPFLTADQPIINTYSAFGGNVNKHDDLEFYYPLSPQKALLLTKKAKYTGLATKVVNETEAEYYNNAMVDLSHEQIYSAYQDQLMTLAEKI